jgi:hypothetical protein
LLREDPLLVSGRNQLPVALSVDLPAGGQASMSFGVM